LLTPSTSTLTHFSSTNLSPSPFPTLSTVLSLSPLYCCAILTRHYIHEALPQSDDQRPGPEQLHRANLDLAKQLRAEAARVDQYNIRLRPGPYTTSISGLNSVSGLVSNIWCQIPFDQSELSISEIPPTDCPTGTRSMSKQTLDFEEIIVTSSISRRSALLVTLTLSSTGSIFSVKFSSFKGKRLTF
jgi:hypothetical protein